MPPRHANLVLVEFSPVAHAGLKPVPPCRGGRRKAGWSSAVTQACAAAQTNINPVKLEIIAARRNVLFIDLLMETPPRR